MAVAVEVVDRFGGGLGDRRLAEHAALAACAHAQCADIDIAVLLTDDDEIARLHDAHLGDPKPTDVMSFAMGDSIQVVVSVECVERRAGTRADARAAELVLYVVHGVLHACGYDDHDASDRARMRDAERAVLATLGVHVARFE